MEVPIQVQRTLFFNYYIDIFDASTPITSLHHHRRTSERPNCSLPSGAERSREKSAINQKRT